MRAIVIAVLIASVFILTCGWKIFQWTECRSMGFSRLYCLKHID